MDQKKVVLIATADDYTYNDRIALLAPSLGILALGSYLAAHDVPVELIDVQVDFGFGLTRATERIISQRIAQYLHDQVDAIAWIGISQFFNNDSGLVLAQEIHTALPNTPIILGGHFPSCNYPLLLKESPFITAIVRGDGETAALEISRSVAQGRSFLSAKVSNLAWLDEGEIRTTLVQPVPVDDLPILDFRLLRNPGSYQIIALITSRGCPFQCIHCIGDVLRPYAALPSEWLARQLAHLEAEMPNERVFIHGPIFGIERKRTLELCRAMSGRRFTYGVESRVDVLEPDLIPALRAAGVELMLMEMGSASTETLIRMNRARSKSMAEQYVRKAIELLKACFENDVTILTSFMLPFPGDSEDDFRASLEFAREANQLHSQIAAQTGVEAGFLPYALPASIYDDTLLAKQLDQEYPETILQSEPAFGERTVLSPSRALDPAVIEQYQDKMLQFGTYLPQTIERARRYIAMLMMELEHFLATHPELTDDCGIIRLGDSVRHLLS